MVLSGIHKALILQELDSRLNTSGMTFWTFARASISYLFRDTPLPFPWLMPRGLSSSPPVDFLSAFSAVKPRYLPHRKRGVFSLIFLLYRMLKLQDCKV